MRTPIERHFKAPNSVEFIRLLARFAAESYRQAGTGVVVIQDGQFRTAADAQVETTVLFVPYEPEQPLVPPDAVEMLDLYDPKKEWVLAVMGPDGRALCLRMDIADTHLPPRSRNVPYLVGAVLHLKTRIGEIQPGYYLFRGERGASIRIIPVAMYDELGFLPGDSVMDVHSDFCELFERTGTVIHPRWW